MRWDGKGAAHSSCVHGLSSLGGKKSFRFATPPNRSHSLRVRVSEMVWGRGKTLMDARFRAKRVVRREAHLFTVMYGT